MHYRSERMGNTLVLYTHGSLLTPPECIDFLTLLEGCNHLGEKSVVIIIDAGTSVGAYFLGHILEFSTRFKTEYGSLCLVVSEVKHRKLLQILGVDGLIPVLDILPESKTAKKSVTVTVNHNPVPARPSLLYVDDEMESLQLFRRVFHSGNYEVLLTDDPQEAIATLSKTKVDVAIVDVNMPKMNGFVLLKHLKKVDNDLPVIVLTAQNDNKTVLCAAQCGSSGFLEKPFRPQWLKAEIETVLAKSKHQRV